MDKLLLNTYINQIKNYPLLTAEQEIELSRLVEKGDESAKRILVQSNLRLVISAAKKYKGFNVSLMDLIQEGNIGLLSAAEKFRSSFRTRFSTYAYLWITQAMLRFVRNKNQLIALPFRKENLLRRISNAQEILKKRFGREACVEELAAYLELMPDEITEALAFSYSVTSLDAPVKDGNKATVGDIVASEALSPEENYIRLEERCELYNLMNKLPAMERAVVYNRFNFGNEDKSTTLKAVGEMLGVSPETVRQMEKRAIFRLRTALLQKEAA